MLEPDHAPGPLLVLEDVVGQEPLGVHDRAARVRDGDHAVAHLVGELREPGAGVPETLDRDPDVLARPPPRPGDPIQGEQRASPGRGVTAERPTEAHGLPAITAGESLDREYSSYIQAISRGPVFTSGAGMSRCGPITSSIAETNERQSRSSSAIDSAFGSTRTPPFAPPNGTSSSAVFHVINAEKHRNSSRDASGWNRARP